MLEKIGGASRDRTDDLIVANDALSQLSYSPVWVGWVLDYFISVPESSPLALNNCEPQGPLQLFILTKSPAPRLT